MSSQSDSESGAPVQLESRNEEPSVEPLDNHEEHSESTQSEDFIPAPAQPQHTPEHSRDSSVDNHRVFDASTKDLSDYHWSWRDVMFSAFGTFWCVLLFVLAMWWTCADGFSNCHDNWEKYGDPATHQNNFFGEFYEECSSRCKGYYRSIEMCPDAKSNKYGGYNPPEGVGEDECYTLKVPLASQWKGGDFAVTGMYGFIMALFSCMGIVWQSVRDCLAGSDKARYGQWGLTYHVMFTLGMLYVAFINIIAWNDKDGGEPMEPAEYEDDSGIPPTTMIPDEAVVDGQNSRTLYYSDTTMGYNQFINRWPGLRWSNALLFGVLALQKMKGILDGVLHGANWPFMLLDGLIATFAIVAIYT